MAEKGVEANAHNASGGTVSDTIHGHINDFLVCTELRSGVISSQICQILGGLAKTQHTSGVFESVHTLAINYAYRTIKPIN